MKDFIKVWWEKAITLFLHSGSSIVLESMNPHKYSGFEVTDPLGGPVSPANLLLQKAERSWWW